MALTGAIGLLCRMLRLVDVRVRNRYAAGREHGQSLSFNAALGVFLLSTSGFAIVALLSYIWLLRYLFSGEKRMGGLRSWRYPSVMGYCQQNADLQRLEVLSTKTAGFHHAKGETGLIVIPGSMAAMILMW